MDIEAEVEELRTILRDREKIAERDFEVASALARVVNSGAMEFEARDLVIRALDKRESFNGSRAVLDALVREVGLYPYLDPLSLTTSDLLAYEFNRPRALPDDVVFHRVQTEVLSELLTGKSIVLSAPTSFGKSLIIDAVIASQKFNNIVIVVPTIALIDETRRRLSKFSDSFKIITHHSQNPGERNVFVLTQERVVEREDLENVDFFVIDEFYKLDPHRNDADKDRSYILNHAFYKLHKVARRFYMLGPSIKKIPVGFGERFDCHVIHTDFSTVSSEIVRIPKTKNKLDVLVKLCRKLEDPTLIYCKSPASARKVVEALVSAEVSISGTEHLVELSDWVGEKYHEEWLFARALKHGIGMHHGQIPRALAQFVVREFNNQTIRFLVCTSTLIEGVNTSARNVVVYDHLIATKKFDYFTFNNIRGRSGRMNRHFIGRVILFNDEPQGDLYEVDIPVFTQDDDIPDSLLLQMDESDVDDRFTNQINLLRSQEWLSYETLKTNRHVEPAMQIELARAIHEDPGTFQDMLAWHGEPNAYQLRALCEAIFEFFEPPKSNGVFSAVQLAFRINQLRLSESIDELISEQLHSEFYSSRDNPIEEAIDESLGFMRNWAGYHFPRYAAAIDNIQKDVFTQLALVPGDYSRLISQVESLYMPSAVVALDEYGLPIQIGQKIAGSIDADAGLDPAIERLRTIDVDALALQPIEAMFVEWVKDGLSLSTIRN